MSSEFTQLTVTASQESTMIKMMTRRSWSVYSKVSQGTRPNGESLILITFIRKPQ